MNVAASKASGGGFCGAAITLGRKGVSSRTTGRMKIRKAPATGSRRFKPWLIASPTDAGRSASRVMARRPSALSSITTQKTSRMLWSPGVPPSSISGAIVPKIVAGSTSKASAMAAYNLPSPAAAARVSSQALDKDNFATRTSSCSCSILWAA